MWANPRIGLLLLATACGRENVQWSELRYDVPPLPQHVPLGGVSPSVSACPVSVRAVGSGSSMFAVWWSVRPDSSAELLVARSGNDGKSWTLPVVADSTDRSVRGCGRPAPAIATDSANRNMHIAYFAEPATGRGIFFAHSMDGGQTFHAPVPIVFGDNPAFVAVAASGDRVAIAYDDPNSVEPAVGVALSRTMGHIFEHRENVSNASERAKQPSVQLRGDTIRLWWSDYAADPRISATRTVYREGRWR